MNWPDPSDSYALLVGIEEYHLGPESALNGPALGATQVAARLIKRGVPAGQILLHVAPLAKNAAGIEARTRRLGISTLPASEHAIRDSVIRVLREKRGKLLIIYWCGHGFVEGRSERFLFCSDASQGDWRHINLRSLLEYIGSDEGSDFELLVAIVDACAEETDWSHPNKLPDHRFPVGRPNSTQSQYVFLATGVGQLAFAPRDLPVPLFTHEVLRKLKPQQAWPSFEKLNHSLVRRFEKLRATGRSTQVPSRYFVRQWDGGEEIFEARASSSSPPASAGWLGPELSSKLHAALFDAMLPTNELKRLYRNCLPASVAPRPSASLLEMLEHLVEFPTVGETPNPLLTFVRGLAHRMPRRQKELDRWLTTVLEIYPDKRVGNIGRDAPKHEYFFAVIVRPDEIPRERSGPLGATVGWIASIRCWKGEEIQPLPGGWDPDEPVALEEIRVALVRELLDLQQQLPIGVGGLADTEIVIEFCLPRALLAMAVDKWEIPDSWGGQRPLGTIYPVIVRDVERTRDNDAQKRWKERWDRLHQDPPLNIEQLYWVEQVDARDPKEIFWSLTAEGDHEPWFCVGLGFSPSDVCLTGNMHCLHSPWLAGLPSAIWLREPMFGPEKVRDVITFLLEGALLHDWPKRLKEIRQLAYSPQLFPDDPRRGLKHIQASITLVWDDPYRVPHRGLTGRFR
jgi:hypothetical protein